MVVATPRSSAIARPPASGRLLITPTMAAAIRPVVAAANSAAMLEPRPEIRITMRFKSVDTLAWCIRDEMNASQPSVDNRVRCGGRAALDRADHGRDLAQFPEPRHHGGSRTAGYYQHHADAAIEYAMHFCRRDIASELQPVEDL